MYAAASLAFLGCKANVAAEREVQCRIRPLHRSSTAIVGVSILCRTTGGSVAELELAGGRAGTFGTDPVAGHGGADVESGTPGRGRCR